MTTSSLSNQIAEEAAQLSPEDQQRALDFVRTLAAGRPEMPADVWLRLAGLFSPEDLDEMERAIEEDAQLSLSSRRAAHAFIHQLHETQAHAPQAGTLSSPDKLLRFSGAIPPEDLDEMERIIEDSCENIDDAE